MTNEQFNKKYKKYLEEGHYGLDIDIPELTEWLDKTFQNLIQKPKFKYRQIKQKFFRGKFYADGMTDEEIWQVEDKISTFFEEDRIKVQAAWD